MKARLGWKGLKAEEYVESGYIFLATPNIKGREIDFDDVNYITKERYDESPEIMLQAGDVLVTKDGSTTGTTALVRTLPGEATVNSSIAVLRPSSRFDSGFLYHFFTSDYVQHVINRMRGGMGVPHLFQADLRKFFAVLPPIEEQAQIAKFLDYETAKIDALIDKQEQLVALLKEKRQAVISHAVTKGLNPDAPMRHSGVEWLGDVPAHWAVGKAGHYISILSGFAFPSSGFSMAESDVRLLRGANVGVGAIRWDDTVRWRRHPGDGLDRYMMAVGDLVIGMDRPVISAGVRVATVTPQDVPSLLLQRVARLEPQERILGDFLMFLFSSEMFDAHFSPETTGVSVPHISPAQIRDFVVPIPPLDEQEAILGHLHAEAARLEKLVAGAGEAVALMQERRSALISAAVTGKIDVRNWKPPATTEAQAS